MPQPSAREQLLVELVNHARLDPLGEAARLGISLNEGLEPKQLTGASKPPLAVNFDLVYAARAHSSWMLAANVFSHVGKDESWPNDRLLEAGYDYRTEGGWWGENISWQSLGSYYTSATAIYAQHDALFKSPAHRAAMLLASFKEIGIGQILGDFSYNDHVYDVSMVTENFGSRGAAIFLTGVVYTDKSGDGFYSVGEGQAKLSVSVGGAKGKSLNAGGYQIETEAGSQTVIFGSGTKAARLTAQILDENAKIDFIDGKRIETSVSVELIANVGEAKLLGTKALTLKGDSGADILTGNKGGNVIHGGSGDDRLYGGAGKDKLYGGSGSDRLYGGSGADRLDGGSGSDRLYGGSGNDTLYGGSGADKLHGGSGADVFAFKSVKDSTVASKGRDTIDDFSRAQKDRIDLSAIDANTKLEDDQAFTFRGTKAFTRKAGELRYKKSDGDTYLYGDVDGDGKADFAIHVDATVTFRASDFIL